MMALIPPPKTYSTSTRRLSLVASPPPLLSAEDILRIRFFFTEFEAVCLAANTPGETGDSGCTAYDGGQVRLIDSGVTRKANAIRDVLRRMSQRGHERSVVVLFRLYGGKPPGEPYADFRDLSPIVEMTNAVEEARVELATREGRERAWLTEKHAASLVEGEGISLAEHFWWAAGHVIRGERRVARLARQPRGSARTEWACGAFWKAAGELLLVDGKLNELAADAHEERLKLTLRREARRRALGRRLEDHRADDPIGAKLGDAHTGLAAWREILKRCLEGRTNVRRATETAGASTVHELTSADAMRFMLDYHGKRDRMGTPDVDAYPAWKARRASFVARVRRDAELLRTDAARAYDGARWQ